MTRNAAEGELFIFHGAFTERRDALARVRERPRTFLKPV